MNNKPSCDRILFIVLSWSRLSEALTCRGFIKSEKPPRRCIALKKTFTSAGLRKLRKSCALDVEEAIRQSVILLS